MLTVLRWILVLPAALGAYVVMMFIPTIMEEAFGFNALLPEGWGYELSCIGSATIGAYFFMKAGLRVIPNHKRASGLVLLVAFSFGSGILASLDWTDPWRPYADIYGTIQMFLGVLAAFLTYKHWYSTSGAPVESSWLPPATEASPSLPLP